MTRSLLHLTTRLLPVRLELTVLITGFVQNIPTGFPQNSVIVIKLLIIPDVVLALTHYLSFDYVSRSDKLSSITV